MTAILDHLAIGTPVLAEGWELFGGVLGGRWAYGGDAPGFWWGQLKFGAGPKIELLTPAGGPDAAFLERFLAARGPGPHHLNFIVDDIEQALARIRALGIEPVGVNLANRYWKEAFLHPRVAAELTWPGGKRIRLVYEDGLPLGGALHHVRFTRAAGAFSTQDTERAGLLAKRLGLTVDLAGCH
jgi:catechol 2,3-dioxygenase-like lactoylglutathione lyase family enzyme